MYYRSKNRPQQAQAQAQSQEQDQAPAQEQSDKQVDSGMFIVIGVISFCIYGLYKVFNYWSRDGEEIRSLMRSLVPEGEFVVAQSPSPNSPSS